MFGLVLFAGCFWRSVVYLLPIATAMELTYTQSDFIYYLQHPLRRNVFNASSVLDIVRTRTTRSGVKQFFIKISTTILVNAAEKALHQTLSKATFSHIWIPISILEFALPEMVLHFKEEIAAKIRTPTGKRREPEWVSFNFLR